MLLWAGAEKSGENCVDRRIFPAASKRSGVYTLLHFPGTSLPPAGLSFNYHIAVLF
jgi:hypothetical protein